MPKRVAVLSLIQKHVVDSLAFWSCIRHRVGRNKTGCGHVQEKTFPFDQEPILFIGPGGSSHHSELHVAASKDGENGFATRDRT